MRVGSEKEHICNSKQASLSVQCAICPASMNLFNVRPKRRRSHAPWQSEIVACSFCAILDCRSSSKWLARHGSMFRFDSSGKEVRSL